MSLKDLLGQNKIITHKTSRNEINELLKIIERDIKDAALVGLSADRKFITAYNEILQATTVILYLNGYKAKGEGHHYFTFLAAKYFVEEDKKSLMDYFNACRAKRNISDYDRSGIISEEEAAELLEEAKKFFNYVKNTVLRIITVD